MNTVTTPTKFEDDFGSSMPIKLCKQELWRGMGQCWHPVMIRKHDAYKSGYQVYEYCNGHQGRRSKSTGLVEEPIVPKRNNYTAEESAALQKDMSSNLFGYRFDRRCYQINNYTETGYMGAHLRVRRIMGKASLWNCVDCGYIAADWSYNHSGEYERVATDKQNLGQPYSIDYKQYEPRCKSCHKKFDNKTKDARDSEGVVNNA